MIKEYFHIAHLISRHLSGEVTPEESRFLDKWRKESKSHEQLFQKICSDEHYAQHEIRKMEFDSQGWMERCRNTYQEDGAQKETFETVTVRCSFYCTSADIGFCTSGYFLYPMSWMAINYSAAQQILPGGAKAILTLDNGETVYLDDECRNGSAVAVGW